ncbi:hypothetical protein ACFLXE_00385, partial [Chloroflexota bacterium]
ERGMKGLLSTGIGKVDDNKGRESYVTEEASVGEVSAMLRSWWRRYPTGQLAAITIFHDDEMDVSVSKE